MRRWLLGVGLAAGFLVAAVALFPLRVALDVAAPTGLQVREASGTIWRGRLNDVNWRGQRLGDFDASMSLIEMLPSPGLRLANGSGPLKSAVVHGAAGGFTVADATIVLPVSHFADAAPTDLAISITDGATAWRDGACVHARGRIASPPAPGLGLPAFGGDLACEGGRLLARLTSDSGAVVLEINPALDALAFRSATSALEPVLVMLGIKRAGLGT